MDVSHRKVSFAQSFVLFFKNYANFSGRSSRSAYWFWILWATIISIFIEVIRAVSVDIAVLVDLAWTLGTIVPTVAIAVRRLHDVGRSGWWQLIALTVVGIIPLFIWFVRAGDSETNKYGDNVEAGK